MRNPYTPSYFTAGCWLTIVPSLPVLSDPKAFPTILAAQTGITTLKLWQLLKDSSSRHLQTLAWKIIASPSGHSRDGTPHNSNKNTTSSGTSGSKFPQTTTNQVTKVYIHPEFAENFKVMAYYSNRQLWTLCDWVIFHIFDCSKCRLSKFICNDFQFNDNWIFHTVMYGLYALVDLIPRTHISSNGTADQAHWVLNVRKGMMGNK